MRAWSIWSVLAAGLAVPAMGQSHGRTIEIPLRLHAGRMVVPVTAPNGAELEFIVTTGSVQTVLSRTGAKRIEGATEVDMGGVTVSTSDAARVDDSQLTFGGRVFDGMVASNTLNQFDILIDVPAKRLLLKPPGRSVDWGSAPLSGPVPLRVYHGAILALDVTLNGKTFPGMLDLGSESLVVNERVGEEASIEGDRARTLELGETVYRDIRVHVEDLPIFQRVSPNGEGFVLVGASIAAQCAVSLSWVHQELRTCVP